MAAQGGKLKSRGKCGKREERPCERDMETAAKKRKRGLEAESAERAGVRRSEREGRSSEGEGERDPKKNARRSRRSSGAWGGTFISRTLRKADGQWKTGER